MAAEIGSLIFVLWMLSAFIVGWHASMNDNSPVIWGLMTLIFGIFGLMGYFAVVAFDD